MEEHNYFTSGGHKGDLYYYTLGGSLLGALDNTGKTTFYLSDALGSVLASFSSAAGIAAIKGNQVFGPYGNARDSQGTINTAKGFTGQYNDSLTGLDYYGSRYYDQVAGVFLSADTVQGNGSGVNPYAYVAGNPEILADPSGQAVIMEGGGGIGLAGEAGVGADLGGGSVPDAYYQAFQGSPASATDPTLSSADSVTLQTDANGDSVTYTYNPSDQSIVKLINNGTTAGYTYLPNTPGYQQAFDAYTAAMNPTLTAVNMAILARMGFHLNSGSSGIGGPRTQTGNGGQQPPNNTRPPTAPPPEREPAGGGNTPPKVKLYRAVGPSELNDLLRFGDYGLSPNQSGKYFALTEQGAWDFALSGFNSERPMTVTSIEVPNWMLERGYIFSDPGGGGLSIHFEDDVLINDLYELMGLPEIIGAPWAGWGP